MLGLLLALLAQINPAAQPTPADRITDRTRAILARLEEPIAIEFRGEVALGDVLDHIKRRAKKGPNDPGIPIYIDPPALWRARKTLSAAVAINEKAIPMKDALTRVLAPLTYTVKDDVLIISDRKGIERERRETAIRACDDAPASRALMARLEEPVRIPFPNETPLVDVIAYLEQATGRRPHDRPVEILVVPDGLRDAKSSIDSTIQVDLEGVPLRTSLRLLLGQLGLGCVVKDGRLVIHSRQGVEKLVRAAEGLGK